MKYTDKGQISNENRPERIYHPFGPLYNEQSRVLILGSFPSVKSREQEFFYGHPQNRFWKVMAALFPEYKPDRENSLYTDGKESMIIAPQTVTEKKALILNNGLALWDSIASCEIIYSIYTFS